MTIESVDATVESARPRAEWTREIEYIFLVGCPRSGTTWLQALLAAHPAIYTGPETHFFSAYAPAAADFHLDKGRHVGLRAYQTPESFYASLAETFGALLSTLPPPPSTARYFLEKSPQHAHHAALILKTFPRVRFIHLVRDPRAVIASLLRIGKTWGKGWAPQDVESAITFWFDYYRAGTAIPSLVNASGQFKQVTYEALQRDSAFELRALFQWLALEADAYPHAYPHALDTSSFATIPAPPISESSNPFYPPNFSASPADVGLSPRARRRIEYVLGSTMCALGYNDFDPHFTFWDRVVAPPRVRRIWTRVRARVKAVV